MLTPSMETKMNKNEFAAHISIQCDISLDKAFEVIEVIFSCGPQIGLIPGELMHGGEVSLPGFGGFHTSVRTARVGKHPRTREDILIGERTLVRFKPSKVLKRLLNPEPL